MKRFTLMIGAILLVGTAVLFTVYRLVEQRAHELPAGAPENCQPDADRPRVLVLGDSITHARVSADYIGLLRRRYGDRYRFVNAGINSSLAYDGLRRLPAALEKCRPRLGLVFLGTNDVNATLSEKNRDRYVRSNRLPQTPDRDWYLTNVRKIVAAFRASPGLERIAFYSIPPIGERIESLENRRVAEYNRALNATLAEEGVRLLPLFETMSAYLQGKKIAGLCGDGRYYVEAAVFQYYLLDRDWNEVSDSFGFHLTTDCLHFNDRAAEMMADLAAPLLDS